MQRFETLVMVFCIIHVNEMIDSRLFYGCVIDDCADQFVNKIKKKKRKHVINLQDKLRDESILINMILSC